MRRPNYSILILTILTLLVLQVTFLPLIEVHGVKPDLILIATVFFSLQLGPWFGLWIGLASGLLKDLFSQGLVGGFAFSLGAVGLIVGYHGKLLYKESPFVQGVVTFLASALVNFCYYGLVNLYLTMPPLMASFRYIILPASIYTAIFALPVFFLLQKVFRVTTHRK